MDDTRIRIICAAIKAVRQYGLEGTRIQNISELAGLSPGALYRYFEGKDDLMVTFCIYVDKQAAVIFDHIEFDPLTLGSSEEVVGALLPIWGGSPGRDRFLLSLPGQRYFPCV